MVCFAANHQEKIMCLQHIRRRLGWIAFSFLPLSLQQVMAWADESPPSLSIPIACTIGKNCFVQNYVDADPTGGYSDFTCGHLSYDGHKGTDIRLPDIHAMNLGVAVLAAAPGVVRATRDSMDDISIRDLDSAAVLGREAGNSVAIVHGNGWETQYSHMRRGSVAVRAGQEVRAGQLLGFVGLSGNTEFPHLHFEVRHLGKPVDPFSGRNQGQGCQQNPRNSLWGPEAQGKLRYMASGVLGSGFSTQAPDPGQARETGYRDLRIKTDAPVVAFWVDIFGVQRGDTEIIRLIGPKGNVLAESQRILTRNQAQRFSYIGKRRKQEPWPPGRYRGEYKLLRNLEGRVQSVAGIVTDLDLGAY